MNRVPASKAPVSPERAARSAAHRTAQEILNSDSGIQAVIVVDGKGDILSVEEAKGFKLVQTEEQLQKYASLTAVILSAVDVRNERLGPVDFVIVAFGNMKWLLFRLPSHGLSVGVAAGRSVLCERVYNKIGDIFKANEPVLP